MKKPIYFWPFIIVYRLLKYLFLGLMFVIWFILSMVLELVNAVINGVLMLSYFVYLIIKSPFFVIKKVSHNKKKHLLINDNVKKDYKVLKTADNHDTKQLKPKKELSEKEKKKIEEKQKKFEEKNKIQEEKKAKLEIARKEKEEKIKQEKEKRAAERLEKEKEKIELKKQKQEEKNKLLEEKKVKLEAVRKEKEEKRRLKQEEILNKNKEKLQIKAQEEQRKKNEKEQKYLSRLEEKEEKKRALNEKKKLKEEAKEQRRKLLQADEYKNENVVITKKTFNDRMMIFLKKLSQLPKKIKQKFIDIYNNSTFVKNRKNKRDISRQALLIDFEGEDAVKSNVKVLYEYVAKNAEGEVIKDYFEAFSKVEVHSFLLSEGYEVYSIRTSAWIRFWHGKSSTSRGKIKVKDLIFFTTQLSTYIKAGIPLAESLKILTRQFKNKNYQKIFKAMVYNLTMGENFSEAMEKQGNAFPKLLINMIKTSEMTGELPEALDDMSEYYTESEKTRKQMITAMMYPSIVFIISIAVSTFIMIYVVPKFADIYTNMDTELPGITVFVLGLSSFLENNLVFVIIGAFLIVTLFIFLYKKVEFFRTIIQWLLMHLPVVKNVIIYNEVTMFTKTFASLLRHNVFITDSMEILNKITNNEIYKMLILDTITNLAKGEKISLAFKNHWAFPLPAYEMLVTGEKTGQLPEMMQKVSDYYQELHSNSVTRIKTFVEPIMIVFLTGVVGVIVLSVVIPMFGMYSSLG